MFDKFVFNTISLLNMTIIFQQWKLNAICYSAVILDWFLSLKLKKLVPMYAVQACSIQDNHLIDNYYFLLKPNPYRLFSINQVETVLTPVR